MKKIIINTKINNERKCIKSQLLSLFNLILSACLEENDSVLVIFIQYIFFIVNPVLTEDLF